MLQLPIISLFLRTLPEGILAIWISYLILKKPIDKKSLFISGVILGGSTYIVRMFPINFGIHIILILMIYIFLLHRVNNINLYQAVTASVSTYILLIISEWITVVTYVNFLGIHSELLLEQSLRSILMSSLSLVLLFFTGLLIKHLKKVDRPGES